MIFRQALAVLLVALATTDSWTTTAFVPSSSPRSLTTSASRNMRLHASTAETNKNVLQTENTSREEIMTFSYDMSLEPMYEKPTYPGTGNGQSGDAGEYDVVVIGSGMGGLACGALSAKYGDKVIVLESHIKCGGSAHTFSRMHKGGKYSFEVGPSIFEGLDRPSLNPLRMIFDILEEEMPVKTYTGLGYWTPSGYWRFPIGSKKNFEDLLMEQAEDGPKAVQVGIRYNFLILSFLGQSTLTLAFCHMIGMECSTCSPQDAGWLYHSRFLVEPSTGRWFPCHYGRKSSIRLDASRCLFGSSLDV